MAILLIQIGLGVFALMGMMHGIYTLRDFKNPYYFAPRDHELVTILETAGMGITREQNNFWKAYLGFHLSHSVGIMVFAVIYFALSIIEPTLLFHPVMACLLVGTGVIYLILSKNYWFSKPVIGSGVAVSLFLIGQGVHILAALS